MRRPRVFVLEGVDHSELLVELRELTLGIDTGISDGGVDDVSGFLTAHLLAEGDSRINALGGLESSVHIHHLVKRCKPWTVLVVVLGELKVSLDLAVVSSSGVDKDLEGFRSFDVIPRNKVSV